MKWKIYLPLLLACCTALVLGKSENGEMTGKTLSWAPGVSIPLSSPDLEDNLKWAGEAGFKWVEVDLIGAYSSEKEVMEEKLKTYKAAADKAGLKIWSVHIPYSPVFDPSEADAVKRKKCRENILQALDYSQVLGSYKYAILHPSYEPVKPEERSAKLDALKEEIKELAPLVEGKYKVRLALESLPRTCLMNTSKEALEILSVSDSVVHCLDTNHQLQEPTDAYARALGKKIATIHASDYDGINERHWIPGAEKGIIKWVALVDALQKAGYNGPFMFEVTTKPWQDDMKQFYADLIKSWEKIKSDYEKASSGAKKGI